MEGRGARSVVALGKGRRGEERVNEGGNIVMDICERGSIMIGYYGWVM